MTEEQLADLEAMMNSGLYPGVEELVSAYEHHCCIVDQTLGLRTVEECGE